MRAIKASALLFALAMLSSAPALALERNSSTNKFNWGDDLSETVASPGNPDYATKTLSPLKSNHITDIKSAVDQSAAACGVTSDIWTGTDRKAIQEIGASGSAISAAQLNGLRRAIEALYVSQSNPNIANYFTGSVSAGEPISKTHIHNMRRALDDLVATCSGVPSTPVCGNGTIESGESCDDGNTASADGCSSACQIEKTWKTGPLFRTMGYAQSEACELAGSAWTQMTYFCGSSDSAGSVCDGSYEYCVYGPGMYSGIIPPAPYGPGMTAKIGPAGGSSRWTVSRPAAAGSRA